MKSHHKISCGVNIKRQGGAVLFVALMLLVILTMLGISNMQVGVMEERMTGGFNDRNNLAFESAELALREAEKYLNGVAVGPFNNSVRGMHPVFVDGSKPEFWQTTAVSASNPSCPASGTISSFNWLQTGATDRCSSVSLVSPRQIAGTAEPARYVIEELADVPKPGTSIKAGVAKDSSKVYRITARGVGGQATTVVILQSTFKR